MVECCPHPSSDCSWLGSLNILVHKHANIQASCPQAWLMIHTCIYWPQFLNILSTCEDHLSPSGTIERARQAVESASRCILANRAAAQNREDDSVFVESGRSIATNKQGTHKTWDNLSGLSSCYRNWDKFWPGGPQGSYADLPLPPSTKTGEFGIRSWVS